MYGCLIGKISFFTVVDLYSDCSTALHDDSKNEKFLPPLEFPEVAFSCVATLKILINGAKMMVMPVLND